MSYTPIGQRNLFSLVEKFTFYMTMGYHMTSVKGINKFFWNFRHCFSPSFCSWVIFFLESNQIIE